MGAQTWLQNHVATIARHHFDDLRERMGWTKLREAQMVSRNPLLVWSMPRDGKIISLTPRSVVAPWLQDGSIVVLPVSLGMPLESIGYYWQPERASPVTLQFANALSAVMSADQSTQTS